MNTDKLTHEETAAIIGLALDALKSAETVISAALERNTVPLGAASATARIKGAAVKLAGLAAALEANTEETPDFEADAAPKPERRNRTKIPDVRFMLTDASLNWVQYDAAKTDGRTAFKDFHGRAPRAGFMVYMCHKGTAWDGAGGYSIPSGEWAPVRVL
jgi:hypothetical protein